MVFLRGTHMVATKKSRGRSSPKRKRKSKRAGKGSATWEEHNERVRYQAALSTERFLQENREKIGSSPAESIARNSYLAGMIDMLSTARGTFGFWGADQILSELERVNRRFAQVDTSPHAERGVVEEVEGDSPGAPGAPQPGPHSLGSVTAKASKGLKRDPMYA